jgi:hypothetical protein
VCVAFVAVLFSKQRLSTDNKLLAPYLDQLRLLPFVRRAGVTRSPGASTASIHIEAPSSRQSFTVAYVSSHLQKSDVELWVGRAREYPNDAPVLLLAPHVGGPLGSRLREAGIRYIDASGNAFLTLDGADGPQHVALVEGRVPLRAAPMERAWRAPSYQVLFTLLATPSLIGAPVREVATQAEVSTTPVLQVRQKLMQLGFVGDTGRGLVWTPNGRERGREFWLRGYQATLRPALLIHRFRPRAPERVSELEEEIGRRLDGHFSWRWGGAAAAFRLDHYYRGETTVLHVHAPNTSGPQLGALLRMLPDPSGPVIVLRRPGLHAFDPGSAKLSFPALAGDEAIVGQVVTSQPHTVHPLLVWAELLEEGHDRASQAAAQFAASFLKEKT